MKLDFQLSTLSGTPGEGEVSHAGKLLATALYHDSGNSLKFHDWALKLYNNNDIILDQTDKEVLIAWIETYGKTQNQLIVQAFTPIGVRAQIIKAIKNDSK